MKIVTSEWNRFLLLPSAEDTEALSTWVDGKADTIRDAPKACAAGYTIPVVPHEIEREYALVDNQRAKGPRLDAWDHNARGKEPNLDLRELGPAPPGPKWHTGIIVQQCFNIMRQMPVF
ncbi:predicted protein [Coccidioides posadasii str. Silveira]|uniref:Predicted protein n=1 Tax=Coccidioides posadasii (strain RMSCC 757 / Silveira) TaxID=443226 RepID=E9DC13_COCPS|nr:predicted protein [Coccidioides posadasii str. Silveira]